MGKFESELHYVQSTGDLEVHLTSWRKSATGRLSLGASMASVWNSVPSGWSSRRSRAAPKAKGAAKEKE